MPDGSIVVRSLPYPPPKRGDRGSVIRKCRTEASLFALSRIRCRSVGNKGCVVRKYRTEALPFGISRDRGILAGNRRTERCRSSSATMGKSHPESQNENSAVRRQPRPASPPRPMPPPPKRPRPAPPRVLPKPPTKLPPWVPSKRRQNNGRNFRRWRTVQTERGLWTERRAGARRVICRVRLCRSLRRDGCRNFRRWRTVQTKRSSLDGTTGESATRYLPRPVSPSRALSRLIAGRVRKRGRVQSGMVGLGVRKRYPPRPALPRIPPQKCGKGNAARD